MGEKVLTDIQAAHSAHKDWWEFTKEEFAEMKTEVVNLAHTAVSKIESQALPVLTGIAEDQLTIDLVDEIKNLAASKVNVSAFIQVAVVLIKRAAIVDENAKQQFESLYNQ